ncbi:MAG: hypothetical protein Q8K45_16535, partial [Rubrivivax sp.]|nr:hypothetical protein [Rubrivivax sp.]
GAARLGDWAAAPAPEALTRLAAPEAPSAAVPALPSPSPAVAAELPTATTPLALPPPLPPPLPQAVERRLASPLAAPPGRARASPALAAPAAAVAPLAWPAAPPALVQPLAPVAAPQALSMRVPTPAATSLPVPALAPVPGAADLPNLPDLPSLPNVPDPSSAAALPALAPAPAPAALPEQPLPRLARPLPTTTVPVTPLVSPDRKPVDPAASVPLPQALPTLGPAPSMPAVGAAPAPAGTPDAGSQVGHDVATPPSAAASVLPRLNLQLARPRGGELSRFSAPGVLPLLPRPPELPDKLARDIAKSAKGDCRTAYQGAGLLAVVPLAAEALRKDSGCKW